MDVTLILEIAAPITLDLVVDTGYVVVPDAVPAAEPLFVASEAAKLQPGDKARIDDALMVTARLSEFDTEQKKQEARESLGLNIIDGGTFN